MPVSQCTLDGRRDAITDLLTLAESFDETGVTQNAEMMRYMRLRTAKFLHEFGDTSLSYEQALQNSQASFVGQGFQNRRALTGSQKVVGNRPFHQQQLPFVEQVTASPVADCPARLSMAKCGAYSAWANTARVLEQISNGSPRR